jgi:hypothetical protein
MMTTDTKEQSNNAAALAKPLLPPPNEEPVVAFASEEDIEQGAYLLQKESILDTGNAIKLQTPLILGSHMFSFSHFGSGVDSG